MESNIICFSKIDCQNLANSVCAKNGFCECLKGYERFNKTCQDFDECSEPRSFDCDIKSDCVNKIGGYFCRCMDGYFGEGTKNHCYSIFLVSFIGSAFIIALITCVFCLAVLIIKRYNIQNMTRLSLLIKALKDKKDFLARHGYYESESLVDSYSDADSFYDSSKLYYEVSPYETDEDKIVTPAPEPVQDIPLSPFIGPLLPISDTTALDDEIMNEEKEKALSLLNESEKDKDVISNITEDNDYDFPKDLIDTHKVCGCSCCSCKNIFLDKEFTEGEFYIKEITKKPIL
ncbi:unnamed protein product [Gordionus sp. m RMFG-2023]